MAKTVSALELQVTTASQQRRATSIVDQLPQTGACSVLQLSYFFIVDFEFFSS